jgi:hypothetical protein
VIAVCDETLSAYTVKEISLWGVEHCKTKGFEVAVASCRARAESSGGVELFDEVNI